MYQKLNGTHLISPVLAVVAEMNGVTNKIPSFDEHAKKALFLASTARVVSVQIISILSNSIPSNTMLFSLISGVRDS